MATNKQNGGRSPERMVADAKERERRARKKAGPRLFMEQSVIHVNESHSRELKRLLESHRIGVGAVDEDGMRCEGLPLNGKMSASDSCRIVLLALNSVDDWGKVEELIAVWLRGDDI